MSGHEMNQMALKSFKSVITFLWAFQDAHNYFKQLRNGPKNSLTVYDGNYLENKMS